MSDFWAEMEQPGPDVAVVGGREIAKGSRVLLRPSRRGDILDLALDGQAAVVQSLEEDAEGKVHVAVTLESDPGRDLGDARFLGHRFFFALDEVEPLVASLEVGPRPARVLVAGIGNVFLGDDGFGVAVARRLARRRLPAGIQVADFGIRGMDLAYALQEELDAVVLVDAAPRGESPGTLTVLEPELEDDAVALDTHGMDPVKVLGLARALGRVPPRILVVACEPESIVHGEHDEALVGELSACVEAAVAEAVPLIESLLEELLHEIESTEEDR